jgi:RHS repeat-associated protein
MKHLKLISEIKVGILLFLFALPCIAKAEGFTEEFDPFHTPDTAGCHRPPASGGTGGSLTSSGTGCSSCAVNNGSQASVGGMPDWKVIEPNIDLRIHDEPLAYQSSVSRISFQIDYWQRSGRVPDTNVYTMGPGWECSWQSYISYNGMYWTLYSAGGGEILLGDYLDDGHPPTYYQNLSLQILTNDSSQVYGVAMLYPSGAKDVYAHAVTDPDGNVVRYDLSQKIDEHGRATTFVYAPGNPIPSAGLYDLGYTVQISYVIDPDGKTNTLSYTNRGGFNFLISQVQDPYGHAVNFAYDTNGYLTNVMDVAGISSSFSYANIACGPSIYGYSTNYWLNQLKTPYGPTSFTFLDTDYYDENHGGYYIYLDMLNGTVDGAIRTLVVTEPNGSHQMFMYRVYSAFANNLLNWAKVPTTTPDGSYLDNSVDDITNRNSFYWGRKQFANLSASFLATGSTNWDVTKLGTGDFLDARWRRWLWEDGDIQSDTLSMEQDPSPDGSTPGQSIWYSYPGQTTGNQIGSSSLPSLAIKILPDGTQWFEQYQMDQWGNNTNVISTWSAVAGGTVQTRTNSFVYSADGTDLLLAFNADGTINAATGYDSGHQPLFVTNAVGEVTSYTYNTNEQPTSVTYPSQLLVTNIYGTDGFLSERRVVGIATNIYTYTNGLVLTHTDELGLKVTNTWDLLQRLIKVSYPDGTSDSHIYTNLDLIEEIDRMGYPTFYAYNQIRQKTYETNALGKVTGYGYCDCGALLSVVDALNNTNFMNYDNQGNLTNVLYPDGSSVNRQFDLIKRPILVWDGAGRWQQFAYNNQSLVTGVTNANGTLQSVVFDIMDRPVQTTDANGVTVTNTFDPLGRPLSRRYPNGSSESWGYTPNVVNATSYTNQDQQPTFYGWDPADRLLAETNANQEVITNSYNARNQLIDLCDGNKNHTRWQFNQYGWPTNKINAFGSSILAWQYNANGWLTNRWTPEKTNTFYTLDHVGNRIATLYPQSSILFAFDAVNRLTNMVDAVGTNNFTYTQVGRLQSEGGIWPNDTVSSGYSQGLLTNLSLAQPGGLWNQAFVFDTGSRLQNIVSPAGKFIYGFPASTFQFPTTISLPNGAKIVNSYNSMAQMTGTALNNYWGHTLDGYGYTPDAMGLRTNIARNFGLTASTVTAAFDNIGQLTSWSALETNGTPRMNEQLAWQYDSGHNLHTRTNGSLVQSFTTDAANQLTNVIRSGTFTMSGATPAPATNVTVNGLTAQTYSDFTFARTNLTLTNSLNTFTNIAVNAYGVKVTNMLTVNFPQSVSLKYDQNGNLTNDGLRTLAYDAENQLTNVTIPNFWRKDFVYDGLNRLRIKREFTWSGSAWAQTNEIHLIWDRNVIVQFRNSNNVPTLTLTRGLDLSGTLQGAGGIGGLLAMTDAGGTNYYYHCDGSGNITALLDAQENVVGRREYDGFGRTISLSGAKVALSPFWFSSQLHDDDTDFYLYKHRAYSPSLQRWLNKDPIGENGGINLYEFVKNNPLSYIDLFGNAASKHDCSCLYKKILKKTIELIGDLSKYDYVMDSYPHPMAPEKGGGWTKPGGHYKEILQRQSGLLDDILNYVKRCLNDNNDNNPKLPTTVYDSVFEKIKAPKIENENQGNAPILIPIIEVDVNISVLIPIFAI